CSPSKGLHPRSQNMVATLPVSHILLPKTCERQGHLTLKVRSIVPGQFLTLRAGAQELARLELHHPDTWPEIDLPLSFQQVTRNLDLVCSAGRPHEPILEFSEIRLQPVAADAGAGASPGDHSPIP